MYTKVMVVLKMTGQAPRQRHGRFGTIAKKGKWGPSQPSRRVARSDQAQRAEKAGWLFCGPGMSSTGPNMPAIFHFKRMDPPSRLSKQNSFAPSGPDRTRQGTVPPGGSDRPPTSRAWDNLRPRCTRPASDVTHGAAPRPSTFVRFGFRGWEIHRPISTPRSAVRGRHSSPAHDIDRRPEGRI